MIAKLKSLTNTEDKKRLLSNFFSLSVLQAANYILPLITLPYLVKVLGIEKFGIIMFAQAFIMFFNVLVDYGFNLSATREVSIHRENKEKITEIFSSVMAIKIVLVAIVFIALSIIIFSFEKLSAYWELYYLTFLWVIGQALFPIWYFQGIEKMEYITIINITSKSLFTIAIFIFIQNESDYIYVPLLNGLGFIIAGFLSLYITSHRFNQSISFKLLKFKKHLKNGFHIFLSMSSSTILSASPIIFIGFFIDYTIAGYYSAFEKIIFAIKNFFYIINQVYFPRLAKVYTENKNRYLIIWKKLSLYTISISILLYIILYLISDIFIKYYFNKIFLDYIYIFHILSFSIVFYTIINSLGLNGLLVIGKHNQLSRSQIIPTIIFIFISPLILKVFGFTTFLFSILIADLMIIFIRIYYLKSCFNGKS